MHVPIMIFSYIASFTLLVLVRVTLVISFSCRIILYQDGDFGGTDWDRSTSNQNSKTWEGGADFDNDEASSYKYYCGTGYSCSFRFCGNENCDDSKDNWEFTKSCSPGGSGSSTSFGDYNDELSEIQVTITATPGPTPQPTPKPTPRPTKQPTKDPTGIPSPAPTEYPTPSPTNDPSAAPSDSPSQFPTASPSEHPSMKPTEFPSFAPTYYCGDLYFNQDTGIDDPDCTYDKCQTLDYGFDLLDPDFNFDCNVTIYFESSSEMMLINNFSNVSISYNYATIYNFSNTFSKDGIIEMIGDGVELTYLTFLSSGTVISSGTWRSRYTLSDFSFLIGENDELIPGGQYEMASMRLENLDIISVFGDGGNHNYRAFIAGGEFSDFLYINNVNVYNITPQDWSLFSFDRTEKAEIYNLKIECTFPNTFEYNNILINFVKFAQLDMENITISNYYNPNDVNGGFLTFNQAYSNFNIKNVYFLNVNGQIVMQFMSNFRANEIIIDNIQFIGGANEYNHGQTSNILLQFYRTIQSGLTPTFTVENSHFSDYILHESAISVYGTSSNQVGKIHIENTLFTNMTQLLQDSDSDNEDEDLYGFIDIRYNSRRMIIDNVLFSSLVNFSCIIHCHGDSECNIVIQDSTFNMNDSDSNSDSMYTIDTAILCLDVNASATVDFINNTFIYDKNKYKNESDFFNKAFIFFNDSNVWFSSAVPSRSPTTLPTPSPSMVPSKAPSRMPSMTPFSVPSQEPTGSQPIATPTTQSEEDTTSTTRVLSGLISTVASISKENNNSNETPWKLLAIILSLIFILVIAIGCTMYRHKKHRDQISVKMNHENVVEDVIEVRQGSDANAFAKMVNIPSNSGNTRNSTSTVGLQRTLGSQSSVEFVTRNSTIGSVGEQGFTSDDNNNNDHDENGDELYGDNASQRRETGKDMALEMLAPGETKPDDKLEGGA